MQSALHASAHAGSRKGGVVWHTQGAGKGIEMTCLAGALMACPDIGNPTPVVVTDRNDLDNQTFGVFAGATEMLTIVTHLFGKSLKSSAYRWY